MTVHIMAQAIWFAVLLQLLIFLMHENVLPLAECSWIYSLNLILLLFYMYNPRG